MESKEQIYRMLKKLKKPLIPFAWSMEPMTPQQTFHIEGRRTPSTIVVAIKQIP